MLNAEPLVEPTVEPTVETLAELHRRLTAEIQAMEEQKTKFKEFVAYYKNSIVITNAGIKEAGITALVKNDETSGYIYVLTWQIADSNISIVKLGYTLQDPLKYLTKRYNPPIFEVLVLEKVAHPKTIEKLLKINFNRRFEKWLGHEWFVSDSIQTIRHHVAQLNFICQDEYRIMRRYMEEVLPTYGEYREYRQNKPNKKGSNILNRRW